MRAGIIALFIACFVAVATASFSSITVDKVKRNVDISTHIVSVKSEVTFTNNEGTISKFHYLVPAADAEHLAYIVAKDGNKSLTVSLDSKAKSYVSTAFFSCLYWLCKVLNVLFTGMAMLFTW